MLRPTLEAAGVMGGGRFFLVSYQTMPNRMEPDRTTPAWAVLFVNVPLAQIQKTQTPQRLSMVTVVTLLWALTDMDIFFSMNS